MTTEQVLTDIAGVIHNAQGERLYSIRPRGWKPAFDALVSAGIDTAPIFGKDTVFGIRRVEDGSTTTIYDLDSGLVLIEYEA